jgi:hypothetical protein
MELEGWARSFQPQAPEDQSALQKVTGSSNDPSLHSSRIAPKTHGSHSDDSTSESDLDMRAQNDFLLGFKSLCVSANSPRYFGESSGLTLLRSAISAKTKASNGDSPRIDPASRAQRRPEFWVPHHVSVSFVVMSIVLIDLSGNLTVCGLSSETMTFLSQISSSV